MLQKYPILLFIAMSPILRSNGQAVDDGCYKIPPIEKFNMDKLMGTWYIQEVGNDDLERRSCLEYEIFKSGANTVYKSTFKMGNLIKNAASTSSSKVGNTSEHTVMYNGVKRSAWTVDTDYTAWGAYCLCIPEQKEKGIEFVGTRAKNPSKEIIEKAHNSFKKVEINVSKPYLQTMNCAGCD